MTIADNLRFVSEGIAAAALRAGRDPGRVRLMAVTKTVDDQRIRAAIAAGVELLGENYVQEARRKVETMGAGDRWHLIGRLQTNKAKYAVRLFGMVHSVDRLELAAELDRRAREAGRVLPILIEVNVGGEETKSGVPLGKAPELVRRAAGFANLTIQGLMTMPPWSADPEEARPYFRALRELAEAITAEAIPGVTMRELSMGTTGDYPVAVEEGATIVRVGRAIFGERPPRTPEDGVAPH